MQQRDFLIFQRFPAKLQKTANSTTLTYARATKNFAHLFSKAWSRFSKPDCFWLPLLDTDLFFLALNSTDEASDTLRSWSVLCFKSCNSVSTVERRWFIRTSPTSKNTALIAKTPTTIKMVRVAERKVGGHLFLTSSFRLWSILCVTSQLSFRETTLKADKRESNSTLIPK